MRPIYLILCLALLAGCWVVPEVGHPHADAYDWSKVSTEDEQQAIERAQSIDRSAFDHAWSSLRDFAYTRDRVVIVRNEDDEIVGRATQSIAVSGSAGSRSLETLSFDSSGTFESSFWSRFSDSDSTGPDEWPSLLLPEDPLFLAAQGPSYFRYAPLPDTLIGNQVIHVVLTETRPETSRHGIQRAKMYLYDNSLVGLEILFTQQSLLYKELSTTRIVLEHPDSDSWLPSSLSMRSTVGLPFSRLRTYELRSKFTDFRPLS